MLLPAALLLLTACNPWRGVHERESVWWGPAGALSRTADLELVEGPSGEPLRYGPRIVIRSDGLDVDNRSWFLSLPDAAFLGDASTPAHYLHEHTSLLPLSDGHIPSEHRSGRALPALLAVLDALAASHRAAARQLGAAPFDGYIVVVSEPSVSGEALLDVLFTAAQSQYGTWALAGAVDGRLRALSVSDSLGDCASSVSILPAGSGQAVRTMTSTVDLGTCPVHDIGPVLDRLLEQCAPHWSVLAASILPEPADPADWLCIATYFSADTARAGPLLRSLSATHARHPAIRQGDLLALLDEGDPCAGAIDLSGPLSTSALEQACSLTEARRHLTARRNDRGGAVPPHASVWRPIPQLRPSAATEDSR